MNVSSLGSESKMPARSPCEDDAVASPQVSVPVQDTAMSHSAHSSNAIFCAEYFFELRVLTYQNEILLTPLWC